MTALPADATALEASAWIGEQLHALLEAHHGTPCGLVRGELVELFEHQAGLTRSESREADRLADLYLEADRKLDELQRHGTTRGRLRWTRTGPGQTQPKRRYLMHPTARNHPGGG